VIPESSVFMYRQPRSIGERFERAVYRFLPLRIRLGICATYQTVGRDARFPCHDKLHHIERSIIAGEQDGDRYSLHSKHVSIHRPFDNATALGPGQDP
jgi:hypothetical protein